MPKNIYIPLLIWNLLVIQMSCNKLEKVLQQPGNLLQDYVGYRQATVIHFNIPEHTVAAEFKWAWYIDLYSSLWFTQHFIIIINSDLSRKKNKLEELVLVRPVMCPSILNLGVYHLSIRMNRKYLPHLWNKEIVITVYLWWVATMKILSI